MKKVVLSLAVLFSVAMVSCGGNKAAEAQDSDTIVVEETVAVEEVTVDSPVSDSPVADSPAAAAPAEAEAGK